MAFSRTVGSGAGWAGGEVRLRGWIGWVGWDGGTGLVDGRRRMIYLGVIPALSFHFSL